MDWQINLTNEILLDHMAALKLVLHEKAGRNYTYPSHAMQLHYFMLVLSVIQRQKYTIYKVFLWK